MYLLEGRVCYLVGTHGVVDHTVIVWLMCFHLIWGLVGIFQMTQTSCGIKGFIVVIFSIILLSITSVKIMN